MRKRSLFAAFLPVLLLGWAPSAHAAIRFSAEVDKSEITEEESVSLKLNIEQDGGGDSVSDPHFEAPDFDQVTSYQSQYVQSYYENGKFGMRTTLQVTSVLRPRKTGRLSITGIHVRVGTADFKAADIFVQVSPGGSATQPPPGYGGVSGLRGTSKRGDRRPFFVRAEINKEKLFKGEQLIVSYYLYRRVRVFNFQASEFPTLSGFLREELEVPIITNQMTNESVVLDGVAYDRTLLARYAAYPLQEGKLAIDPLEIKANYYSNDNGTGLPDDEDPFFQFFKRMTPKSDTQRSDPLTVEVVPLPEAGKPPSFTGAVGEFDVKAAVDKTEVKAGDPVTLTVLVEGRGNLTSLKEPKANWPQGIELYDSKGRTKISAGGVGEKVFEFLLIPRSPGEAIVPALEFSFFDPEKKEYVTRTTDPIRIQVLPGEPGASPPPRPQGSSLSASPAPALPGLVEPGTLPSESRQMRLWWILLAACLGAGILVWISFYASRCRQRRLSSVKRRARSVDGWDELEEKSRSLVRNADRTGAQALYEELENRLLDTIQEIYGIPARSLPRGEIGRRLSEDLRFDGRLWSRCDELLEHSERVRFGGTDPALHETTLRELERRVRECRELIGLIYKIKI